MVFPPPPDAARIQWLGEFRDSRDLRPARSGWEGLQTALRGPLPPIPFSAPHGIAVRDGRYVAIADGAGSAVHVLDLIERSHRYLSGFGDERFVSPIGVAWVREHLWVTDAGLRQVIELRADGQLVSRFGAPILERPAGIACSSDDDRVYVVDAGSHQIHAYGTTGEGIRSFGGRGGGSGMFNFPTHVTVAGDMVWVADTGNFRVQAFDLDGIPILSFGRKGDAAGDLSLPKGVAVDADGHVYVVDAHFENVQVFDERGRLLLAFGEPGSGPGQFSLPAGIAIDTQDRIWVADSGNHRVQVFQYLRNAS